MSRPNENEDIKQDTEVVEEAVEVDEATKKIEEAEAKYAEANDKYLRILAEYDNFRKRTAKEREGIYTDAFIDAIKGILPVIDNIERILTVSTDEKTLEGIKLILSGVKDTLSKMGVTEIEATAFDPNFHNAVMHVEDDSLEEGTIVEVFQKGYMYKEKVVRYAMVKVAN